MSKTFDQLIDRFAEMKTGDRVVSCWRGKVWRIVLLSRVIIMREGRRDRLRYETHSSFVPSMQPTQAVTLYLCTLSCSAWDIWDHSPRVPSTRDALQGSDGLHCFPCLVEDPINSRYVPIHSWFSDSVTSSDYISSNGIMISEWIGKDVDQCCPTFLYIGPHLTDGCGGAGALWRLQ
jgi:hypothetical protein